MTEYTLEQSRVHNFVIFTERLRKKKKFPSELLQLVNTIQKNLTFLFQSRLEEDKVLAAEISQLTYKLLTSEPGDKRQLALIPFAEKAQQLKSGRSKVIRTLGMTMLAFAAVACIAAIAVNIFVPVLLPVTFALVAVAIAMFIGGMATYSYKKDSKDRAGIAMERTAMFFRQQDEKEEDGKKAETQPLLTTA